MTWWMGCVGAASVPADTPPDEGSEQVHDSGHSSGQPAHTATPPPSETAGGTGVTAETGATGPTGDTGATADTGDSVDSPHTGHTGVPACVSWASYPELLGTLAEVELDEASGLVVSRVQPGVLWLNNDRNDVEDDRGRLFAVGLDGADLGTYWLDGVENYDFEALAAGVGPDGLPWLFIGDVGDNDHEREDVAIIGFPEPIVDVAAPVDQVISGALVYRATWPVDPPANTEAMAIDPLTGDVWMLTKSQLGLSSLARYPPPLRADETVELEIAAEVVVADVPNVAFTDMAFSPDGGLIVARTYSSALSWFRAADVVSALAAVPCSQDLPPQNLGETIAFDLDGISLMTVSEGAGAAVLRLAVD